MSDIRLSVPKTAKAGDIITLKAMIRHPMESGYRRDSKGEVIPRMILSKFECLLDDELIFSADFGPGIAAQPLTVFSHRAEKSGRLTFRWTEQTGEVFEDTAELNVA